MVERREEASSGRGASERASSFIRFLLRCGGSLISFTASAGGVFCVCSPGASACVAADVLGSNPLNAIGRLTDRSSGRLRVLLAEKYSRRNTFLNLGFAAAMALREIDALNSRPGCLGFVKRSRHREQTKSVSVRLGLNTLACSNMRMGRRISILHIFEAQVSGGNIGARLVTD